MNLIRAYAALIILALLLAIPLAASEPGPDLVPVAYHPYPDASDILGFPAPPHGDIDHYVQAYRSYDANRDGFDFPHVVVDGVTPIEGLPDGGQPFASTKAAYAGAVAQRSTLEAPLTLEVSSQLSSDAEIHVRVVPNTPLPGEDLTLRIVLIEDHVYFEAPPQLSNGITDHRFTARAVASQSIDLSPGAAIEWTQRFDTSNYDASQLYAAAWVQQGLEEGARFQSLEVLQAALHAIGEQDTIQTSKAVLLETYTASWCDACVYGDLAIEELAEEHGAGKPLVIKQGPTYWQGADRPWLTLILAVAFTVGIVRMRGSE